MEQPVQERRGHHLVAGEHLRPVLHRLVRRDQHAAPLVAVAHQAEEEAGLLPRERLEAHLVDDQQRNLQVLLPMFIRPLLIRKVYGPMQKSEKMRASDYLMHWRCIKVIKHAQQ